MSKIGALFQLRDVRSGPLTLLAATGCRIVGRATDEIAEHGFLKSIVIF